MAAIGSPVRGYWAAVPVHYHVLSGETAMEYSEDDQATIDVRAAMIWDMASIAHDLHDRGFTDHANNISNACWEWFCELPSAPVVTALGGVHAAAFAFLEKQG